MIEEDLESSVDFHRAFYRMNYGSPFKALFETSSSVTLLTLGMLSQLKIMGNFILKLFRKWLKKS